MERHNAALDMTGQFITSEGVHSLLTEARDSAYSLHSVSKATGEDKASIDWSIGNEKQSSINVTGVDTTRFDIPIVVHSRVQYGDKLSVQSTLVGDPYDFGPQKGYSKDLQIVDADGNSIIASERCSATKMNGSIRSACSGSLTDKDGTLLGFIREESGFGASNVRLEDANHNLLGTVSVQYHKTENGSRIADATVTPAQDISHFPSPHPRTPELPD
jgi:hypothetical protein